MSLSKSEEVYEVELIESGITEKEARDVLVIQKQFFESYLLNKDKITVEEWLFEQLKIQLPDKDVSEIKEINDEIIESLKITENMKKSQEKAISVGKDKKSWLKSKILEATPHMSTQESVKYLSDLDKVIQGSNEAMLRTIRTKGSNYLVPNQNPNLDGYIAEQHHASSFNMNAKTKGSLLKAEVQPLKPGQTYTKNGFDVIIKDAKGNRIHQYQMKYGSTAEETIKMLKSGNYNNQTIIVPEEQVATVRKAFPNKTIDSTIGEGTIRSNPLTKSQAKKLQKEAQKGDKLVKDYTDFNSKDMLQGIAKNVGHSCLQGALFGAGFNILSKVWNDEEIEGSEVIENAIISGADTGIKAATAGALKVSVEKDIIKVIPKGTSINAIANIAFTAIENVEVLIKAAKGELNARECFEEMERTTGACVAGMVSSAKGAAIGSALGLVLGPIGAGVGGFVGGVAGYVAGSQVAKTLVSGAQKVREVAFETVKSVSSAVFSGAKNVVSGVVSGVGSVISGIGSFFGL